MHCLWKRPATSTHYPHSKKLNRTRNRLLENDPKLFKDRFRDCKVWPNAYLLFSMSSRCVKGLHVNMIFIQQNFKTLLSLILAPYLPFLVGFTREDVRRLFPFFEKNVWEMLRESGYLHIQATKPDTAGGHVHKSRAQTGLRVISRYTIIQYSACCVYRAWAEWFPCRLRSLHPRKVLHMDWYEKQRTGWWRTGKVK